MTLIKSFLPSALLALSVQAGPLESSAEISNQAVFSSSQPTRYMAELIVSLLRDMVASSLLKPGIGRYESGAMEPSGIRFSRNATANVPTVR